MANIEDEVSDILDNPLTRLHNNDPDVFEGSSLSAIRVRMTYLSICDPAPICCCEKDGEPAAPVEEVAPVVGATVTTID